MNIINLLDYDVSYDIQYMKLMIEILKPYIHFQKPSTIFEDRKISIYQEVNTVRNVISLNEYIYFIQYTFPLIIRNELNKYRKEKNYEELRKDILSNQRKGPERFKLPLFMDTGGFEKECTRTVEELNQLNKDEIKEVKEENMNRLEKLSGKINYLEEIQKINREKNGSIDDVIHFIEKLEYVL